MKANRVNSATRVLRRIAPALMIVVAGSVGAACSDDGLQQETSSGVSGAPQSNSSRQAAVAAPADEGEGFTGVIGYQLIDDRHGWIQRIGEVFATDDGGATWRTMATPGGTAALVFFDSQHGLVVTNGVNTENTAFKVEFWFTSNGGRNFVRVPATNVALQHVVALDGERTDSGYRVLAKYGSGGAFSSGVVLTSNDGLSWTGMQAPAAGQIRFSDATHGVIVGGPLSRQIWTTTDGGATWTERSVLAPPGEPGSYPPSVVGESSEDLLFTTTTIEGDVSHTRLWRIDRGIPTPTSSGEINRTTFAVTISPTGKLIAATSDEGEAAITTLDRNGATSSVDASNLGGGIARLSFSSDTQGWALRSEGTCQGPQPKTNCKLVSEVRMTRDGGRNWTLAGS